MTQKPTWYSQNKDKAKAQAIAWRLANPTRWKASQQRWKLAHKLQASDYLWLARWRRLGLDADADTYTNLLDEQHGVCKLCGDPPKKHRFCIDFDEKRRVSRGLVCWKCKIAIKHYEDYRANSARIGRYLDSAAAERQSEPIL